MTYKQYIIIPKKPKMSSGKIASQAVHASFMAIESQQNNNKNAKKIIQQWKNEGQTVIVLECKDQLQLLSAAKYLEQWDISHHLYIDEGHTEVDALVPTALASGILPESLFWLFSQYNLYGSKKSKNYFSWLLPFKNGTILKASQLNWLTIGLISVILYLFINIIF